MNDRLDPTDVERLTRDALHHRAGSVEPGADAYAHLADRVATEGRRQASWLRGPRLVWLGAASVAAVVVAFAIVVAGGGDDPEQVATRSHSSDVLITISNDAWFGTSAGPLQHFQMARMRALETGRWLLRGTNNGVTAVIDDQGKVVDALPQFERDILLSSYQPRQGTTPFMTTGIWPWLLLAGLMMAAGWRFKMRQS